MRQRKIPNRVIKGKRLCEDQLLLFAISLALQNFSDPTIHFVRRNNTISHCLTPPLRININMQISTLGDSAASRTSNLTNSAMEESVELDFMKGETDDRYAPSEIAVILTSLPTSESPTTKWRRRWKRLLTLTLPGCSSRLSPKNRKLCRKFATSSSSPG